jgi:hypothetical protein
MIKIYIIVCFTLIVLITLFCDYYSKPISTTVTDNAENKVSKLFTNEG